MERFLQDLRFACRTLRKRPGFTIAAVFTLGLGIGANVAIFSLVNGLLFKQVPGLVDTRGLVEISRNLNGDFFDISYPALTRLRERSDALQDMAGFTALPLALGAEHEPSVHMGLAVTGNYFAMLGLQPAAGRFFSPQLSFFPQIESSAVISHHLWEQGFQSRADVIGRTIRLNGHSLVVIGVAPKGFRGHTAALRMDIFALIGAEVPGFPLQDTLRQPNSGILEVIGRLKPGVGMARARAELSGFADQFVKERRPDAPAGSYIVRVEEWAPLPSLIRGGVQAFLAVLMILVGLVLAMASVNVANMILSRSLERRNEFAIRLAIGASRGRIVQQLVTESLALFAVAGLFGVFLSIWATNLLMTFKPPLPPGFSLELDFGIDARVLAFSVALSLLSGLFFTLLPALRASGAELLPSLKDGAGAGTPTRTRIRTVLVGGQMAATLILLICAGIFLGALHAMEEMDLGWNGQGVQLMSLDLEMAGYDSERGRAFYQELIERLGSLPAMESFALAAKLPLGGRSSLGDINVEGVPSPEGRLGFTAYYNRVSEGYFRTLEIPLLQGRDIDGKDRNGQPLVAVINRAMAQRFWPDSAAVGKRFYLGRVGNGTPIEVAGVVENTRSPGEATPNFYYLPHQQRYNAQMTLHYRTGPDLKGAIAQITREVREMDPNLPILTSRSMDETLGAFKLPQRLASWIAGLMGIIGLALGAVGTYGVTSVAVAQRTREIGLRLALGARTSEVMRMMLRRGLTAPLAGMCFGLLVAYLLTRVMPAFLIGSNPVGPFTFAAIPLFLGAVALVAVLLPSKRASNLDPARTLRLA